MEIRYIEQINRGKIIMKKIINGKMYNTETARCMGSWYNNFTPDDLWLTDEHLYQKKTGEFFLYKNGGHGDLCFEGKIIPITQQEAREWMEEYDDANR